MEILDAIDEDDLGSGDIVLHIPDEHNRPASDVDSDASDEDMAGDLNRLGPVLMRMRADFLPTSQVEEELEDEDGEIQLSRNKKRMIVLPNWNKIASKFQIPTQREEVPAIPEQVISVESEASLFKLFFDDAFVDYIVDQTNMYAEQQTKTLNVTRDEIFVVFGAFLLSGYAKYPNKRLYWSREKDSPEILSEAIRCNRFEDIIHHIHFNDNQQNDGTKRLYKLSPLLDHLQKKFMELNALDEHLSIDESKIPYYGRHFAKQYIKGKPIRFGYKNWALCSSTGYMYAFDVYVGKSHDDSHSKELGAGGDVVMKLLGKANVPSNLGYKVFFDNYFTSYRLIDHLSSKGICATGTVRENRLLNCPLAIAQERSFQKEGKICS